MQGTPESRPVRGRSVRPCPSLTSPGCSDGDATRLRVSTVARTEARATRRGPARAIPHRHHAYPERHHDAMLRKLCRQCAHEYTGLRPEHAGQIHGTIAVHSMEAWSYREILVSSGWKAVAIVQWVRVPGKIVCVSLYSAGLALG